MQYYKNWEDDNFDNFCNNYAAETRIRQRLNKLPREPEDGVWGFMGDADKEIIKYQLVQSSL